MNAGCDVSQPKDMVQTGIFKGVCAGGQAGRLVMPTFTPSVVA
jgi:hypothetical protein